VLGKYRIRVEHRRRNKLTQFLTNFGARVTDDSAATAAAHVLTEKCESAFAFYSLSISSRGAGAPRDAISAQTDGLGRRGAAGLPCAKDTFHTLTFLLRSAARRLLLPVFIRCTHLT
jgi:hypothetical protein